MSWLTAPLLSGAHRPQLLLLVGATMSGTLGMHVLVPALPLAAADLGVSGGTIQLTITLYLVGLASGQLLYGSLSDRLGRRPVLLGGMALYLAGGIAAWAAPEAGVLIVSRVVQALGGCGGLVLGRAIVRDQAGPAEAASRLALLNLVVSLAPTVAPVVGGYLAIWFGWRSIFALLVALGAATLVHAVLTLPETGQRRPASGRRRRSSGYGRLLRSRTYRGYMIGGACTTTSYYAYLSASPFIFVDQLHRPAEEVGLYYLVVFSGVTLGSLAANRLVRLMRPAPLLRAANLLGILGSAAFFAMALTGQLSVAGVVVSMLVLTTGIGTASPLALTGAISVNPHAIGAASGLYGFVQMGFGALCTLIVSIWHRDPALSASSVLLASTVLGQVALTGATRRGFGRPESR